MSNDAGDGLRFGIDRLVVRGSRIFGWGWIADRRRTIRDLHLACESAGGPRRLTASIGLARRDVGSAFPDLVSAERSGFVVTGYVPDALPRDMTLEVRFDDGGTATIGVGNLAELRTAGANRTPFLRRLARALWRRVRTLDFRGLFARGGARRFGVGSIEDAGVRAELEQRLLAAHAVRVIFDHAMGGGANAYRDRRIDAWVRASDSVLRLTYNLPTLDYRVHLFAPGERPREYRAAAFLSLEPLLQRAPLAELFVNSPVSFDEPALFADWLARMRRERSTARLTVAMHDYFALCPSFVLLDADGRYCGVPADLAQCERCLARHAGAHVAFSPPSRMAEWRRAWGECLAAADEVRCFSEDTRALLLRAYPGLERAATTVVPHAVDFSPARLPKLRHDGPLVIGVIGQISFQKGATIVTEMLARIERDHPDARIVVLGTLDLPIRSPRLEVTGPYRREDLPALIEAHGVNLFLFPSIWPETFSYVVAEMMAMQLPIVAFDLGAPAERLRGHGLARLCGEVSAAAALETVIRFHRELAGREAAAA
jgi:glycosyltransferase involved in cell wall biosynthesis